MFKCQDGKQLPIRMLAAFQRTARQLLFVYRGCILSITMTNLHDWSLSAKVSGSKGASGTAWCDKIVFLHRAGEGFKIVWVTTLNDFLVLSLHWRTLVFPEESIGDDKLLRITGTLCLPARLMSGVARAQ